MSSLPCSLFSANKELGSIGVGPSVGHRQDQRSSVLQCKVFICKLLPVDGFPSGSVASGEISTLTESKRVAVINCVVAAGSYCSIFGRQPAPLLYLAHEFRDDSMKFAACIAKALLSSAQGTEVFCKIQAAILQHTQVIAHWVLNHSQSDAAQQSRY